MSTTKIQQKKIEVTTRRDQLLARFSQAATARRSGLIALGQRIVWANDALTCLDEIEALTARTHLDRPQFAVSSLFLHDAYKKLTADDKEQFVFITGTEVDGRLVLNQIVEVDHQRRTTLGVVAETSSVQRILIRLEQFGHRLLAHFHSHPGTGSQATQPSGTDLGYQTRLERAGHVAVMAVFSRDGFIRFVRVDGKFDIQVFGQGIEQHGTHVFRLTKVD